MTTLTTTPPTMASPAGSRPAPRTIPIGRIISVELRKMFTTRSGFWLVMSVVIVAVLATAGVIAFAPEDVLTYDTYAAAIGVPVAVILPMIAVLSVTSEWSQRSGLSTFTLVPHRRRIILAKLVATVTVAVASMLVTFGVGAVGTLVGSLITGVDPVWDVAAAQFPLIVLGNVLSLMMGFVLGLLLRSSAPAIVAYFVYAFVLPPILELLAMSQQWFADLQPWVDFRYATGALFDETLGAEQWAQLATSGALWLVVPMIVGLVLTSRTEVK